MVGRIIAIADSSSYWKIGQRVGVSRLGGHCNHCAECRQGLFNLCNNQPVMGSSHDGGYAEMLLAKETGLVTIPDELSSVEAAPLVCACQRHSKIDPFYLTNGKVKLTPLISY